MEIWILIVFAAIAVFAIVGILNSMVGLKNQVEFAFASIDAQLKKRYDLIPNLVNTCEKYMGYEDKLLKDLTETRARAVGGNNDDRVALDGQLTSQLRSVFAVAENYPNLKAIESFTLLQRSLNEVEEQLAASRRAFNAAVTNYNNGCEMFPTSVVAGMMGYKIRHWFEAAEEERKPVKVWGN